MIESTDRKVTAQKLASMVVTTSGDVHWGNVSPGADRTVLGVYEIPLSATQTRIEAMPPREGLPMWWGQKHAEAVRRAMVDYQIRLEIALGAKQKHCRPVGLRDDIHEDD